MALSLLSLGTFANDTTGTPLQAGGTIINAAIAAINSGLPAGNVVAGGSVAAGVVPTATANLGIFFGTGAPTFSAAEGSIYSNTTGSAGARLYVNTSAGTGTTWTAASSP